MKKVEFTKKGYEYFLLAFFAFMVISNSYSHIKLNEYPISIPVIFNLAVLFLVFSRIDILKIVLKLYAIIFLIGAPMILILTRLIIGEESIFDIQTGWRVIKILIGAFMILGIHKWIKNENTSDIKLDDHLIE